MAPLNAEAATLGEGSGWNVSGLADTKHLAPTVQF